MTEKNFKKAILVLISISAFYVILVAVSTAILGAIAPESNGIIRIFKKIHFVVTHFNLLTPLKASFMGYHMEVLRSAVISILILGALAYLAYNFHQDAEKKKNLFGNAKWSDWNALKDNRLLDDDGIIVGKYKGRLLKFGGQEFVSLGAPTRSGKGVGVVIPNLLEWKNSIVVLDVKQECFDITSKYRSEKLNQKVYLFDPFSFKTHRYNPLGYLDFDSPDIELQIQRLANSLYPVTGGSKDFFVIQAQSIFTAMVYLLGKLNREGLLFDSYTLTTLAGALEGVNITDEEGEKHFIELDKVVKVSDKMGLLSETILSKFRSFFGQQEATDQFIGIKGSYETPLKIFQDSLFEKATECNDFDFRDLRKEKITIYIGITPENIETAKPILNLFFTQLLFENIKQGLPDTNPELKHNVLLLMDEFTSIGFMSQYQTSITYLAGYNIRSLIIYQNHTQLATDPPYGYGDKGSETLLENHSCQIFYRPKNPKSANDISNRIGNITSASHNKSYSSKDFGVSRSENQTQRALILPQEIMAMEDNEELLFCNSARIKCEKAFFYSDPYFINKLKSVSPMLKKIRGLPNKEQLEKAYTARETAIELPDLRG